MVACSHWDSAQAFDFFGLWSWGESPPPVSPAAISYAITVDVQGGDGALKNAVQDASSLYKLRMDAPPDGDALARRAESDFGPIIDAMWGAGYYDAAVTISIDRVSMTILSSDIAGFARAAESLPQPRSGASIHKRECRDRCSASARSVWSAPTARRFRKRNCRRGSSASSQGTLRRPPNCARRRPGSSIISARRGGRSPRSLSIAPVVDHAAHVMDVTFTVDPGPIAPFGEATMNGPHDFDPAIARSFLYIYPGEPYSPQAVADARNSIRQIPAVGGVRITEGTALDAYGRLPYTVDVEDRLPYAIGASAKYSTTNGPAGQVYWEDRNVFGGAERLRLQADVFYAPPWYVTSQDIRSFSIDDIGWRFSASFLKPALWGTPNDLLVDALGERVSTSGAGFFGYEAEDADVTAALRHRFNQDFWVQAGVEAQTGVATDALGRVNYTLVGVPVSANYDTTDSKLDPTRGVRMNASVDGFPTAFGSTVDLVQAKARASAYYSIDADSRYVLAGLVGAGAMGGAELADIPANWRFYAGGGGSVRGYAYNSLGPYGPFGAVIGGRSLFQISAELRVRVTDTIGIVPFFDAGNAYASNFPNFSAPLYKAVGVGLRYYTAIGPIRADVAFPLQQRPGTGRVALYVSIGQAF